MTNKPILSLDFDGVLHSYTSRWKGPAIVSDPPTEGAAEALQHYLTHFDVQIFSSRSHQDGGIIAMRDWCLQHFGDAIASELGFPCYKPPALIGLDDRILTFQGTWPSVATLRAFRPWNKSSTGGSLDPAIPIPAPSPRFVDDMKRAGIVKPPQNED